MKTRLRQLVLLQASLFLGLACGDHGGNATRTDRTSARPAGLVETGELRAVNAKVVSVPHFKWEYSSGGRIKLVWLEKEGTRVRQGDVVARLDTSSIKRLLDQKQADLDIALADLEQQRVEHAAKLRELEADVRAAEAAVRRAEIDLQRVRYESEAARAISQLRLEIARVELEKARKKMEWTLVAQREERRIQRAKVARIRAEIANARHAIERFALKAPADGMVEYRRNRRTRQKVKVGDEFWQGHPLVSLPNLSQMKVLTTVNEADIRKVRVGQKVRVRLDAYPRVAFEGEVRSVSVTSRKKEKDSKIKVFDVEVLLKEADPILKPGMTVSCELLAGKT